MGREHQCICNAMYLQCEGVDINIFAMLQTSEQGTKPMCKDLTALLRHTNSLATTTGCLCVLTPDSDTPEMSQTPVRTDLLQSLEILSQFGIHSVGQDLGIFAVGDVLLPIEEPCRDLELGRILHDGHYTLEFIRVELSRPLLQIHIGLLANDVGISPAHALDLRESILNLSLAIDVGVEKTENVLEGYMGFGDDE